MSELIFLIAGLLFFGLGIYINQKNVNLEKKGRALLQEALLLNKEISTNIKINDALFKDIQAECNKKPELWSKTNEQLKKSKVN